MNYLRIRRIWIPWSYIWPIPKVNKALHINLNYNLVSWIYSFQYRWSLSNHRDLRVSGNGQISGGFLADASENRVTSFGDGDGRILKLHSSFGFQFFFKIFLKLLYIFLVAFRLTFFLFFNYLYINFIYVYWCLIS